MVDHTHSFIYGSSQAYSILIDKTLIIKTATFRNIDSIIDTIGLEICLKIYR